MKNNKLVDPDSLLHRIRVKLYPSYLPKVEGKYIARTNNQKSLSIEEVCNSMRIRGGFDGNLKRLIEYIQLYYDEVAYLLCDGFSINNGYYSIYPNIGGTFNSTKDIHDRKKNPISFRFGIRRKLRQLFDSIAIEVDGLANTNGFIDTYTDVEENSVNETFLPGNQFIICGSKIKVAGDDPGIGVFFVPIEDPTKAVKATRIAKNLPSEIIGIVPPTIEYLLYRIEIRTQFSGMVDKPLKTKKIIISDFTIESA
ncbi:MAG: DUF4469 domain-containing protein [Treponema sp.]|jgi:hypothetical protein|nr:DUF4469 domain-containing protein [Treponema sp.]